MRHVELHGADEGLFLEGDCIAGAAVFFDERQLFAAVRVGVMRGDRFVRRLDKDRFRRRHSLAGDAGLGDIIFAGGLGFFEGHSDTLCFGHIFQRVGE